MTGAMLGCRPTWTGGDLALPNNKMFLRMLVIEPHYTFATFAICDVVSPFLLRIIWTIILRYQGSIFLAIL